MARYGVCHAQITGHFFLTEWGTVFSRGPWKEERNLSLFLINALKSRDWICRQIDNPRILASTQKKTILLAWSFWETGYA